MDLDLDKLPYQENFCEENVYEQLESGLFAVDSCSVVVVLNEGGTCAMFHQRASLSPEEPIVWDYHVLLVARVDDEVWVIDRASNAACPAPFREYVTLTLIPTLILPPRFVPQYRVIDAREYLDRFHSDRSHMRKEDGTWFSEPPAWPVIEAEGRDVSLSELIRPDFEGIGPTIDLVELIARFTPP